MQESTSSSVDLFDEVYPEALTERLRWLEEQFKIDRTRMLRLMGLPADQAMSSSDCEWQVLVREHEFQAEQLEHLLTHYLSYFDYDAEQAREFATRFSRKAAVEGPRLQDSIPALALAHSDAEREMVLLNAARQEGPQLLPAMALLLGSHSEDENGAAAQPRNRRPHSS